MQEILVTYDTFLTASGTETNINDSGITLELLQHACRRYDVDVSDAEAAAMVGEADRDGDGAVSREEYVAIMKNTCWF
jgi:Ca2+-binding EF-hand superfamily protein